MLRILNWWRISMGWAPFLRTTASWTLWTVKIFFFHPFFLSTAKSLAQELICIRSGLRWHVYNKFWQNFDKNVDSVLIFIEVSIQFCILSRYIVTEFAKRSLTPTPKCPDAHFATDLASWTLVCLPVSVILHRFRSLLTWFLWINWS